MDALHDQYITMRCSNTLLACMWMHEKDKCMRCVPPYIQYLNYKDECQITHGAKMPKDALIMRYTYTMDGYIS